MSANTTNELSVVAVADKKKVKVPKVAKAKKATKIALTIADDCEETTQEKIDLIAEKKIEINLPSEEVSITTTMNPVENETEMSEEELLIAEMEREENERRKEHAEKMRQLKLKKAKRDSEAEIENLRASAVSKYEAKKVANENERKRLEAEYERALEALGMDDEKMDALIDETENGDHDDELIAKNAERMVAPVAVAKIKSEDGKRIVVKNEDTDRPRHTDFFDNFNNTTRVRVNYKSCGFIEGVVIPHDKRVMNPDKQPIKWGDYTKADNKKGVKECYGDELIHEANAWSNGNQWIEANAWVKKVRGNAKSFWKHGEHYVEATGKWETNAILGRDHEAN